MAGHVPTPHETPEEESLEPYLIASWGEEEQQVALKTPYGKAIRKRNGIFKKIAVLQLSLFAGYCIAPCIRHKEKKS